MQNIKYGIQEYLRTYRALRGSKDTVIVIHKLAIGALKKDKGIGMETIQVRK